MVNKPYVFVEEMETPVGPLTLVSLENGLCKIDFGKLDVTLPRIQGWLTKNRIQGEIKLDQEVHEEIIHQLQDYFNGKRQSFNFPVVYIGTPFQIKVWKSLQSIPFGKTKSYKEIASIIGNPKAVRAIGSANNKNPIPIIVPCHRVIGTNGLLVGYAGGLDKKEFLLKLEKSV
ncbi:methylated-DNA--[protein]-cysteine S-methyltransferase [Terrilactibacillus laevilacticus]|uniref:Methylated-DNA--protein-cysteine methyltransferase n=1 Tax=Terrilactibacillus laevilacticus TaxID=1380157 RepID=A0ABW5PUC9_9BACI|nr:methylated-DNA--[protein]-cysteine S-methyltransferase [Terrilactibacillus laevilacticus]